MKKKLKMLKGRFRENTDFIIASDIESARFRILLVIHFCHFSVTLIRRTGQKNKTVQRMERGNFSLERATTSQRLLLSAKGAVERRSSRNVCGGLATRLV